MTTVGDTGWQRINTVAGNDQSAAGSVEMVRGTEARPCILCRSWEKDERRMVEHLLAHGLEARPDGKFVTPIAKDIPGRKSMVLDPKKMGFCRLECIPTEDLATCTAFVQVTKFSEMASRIR